ncbi:kinase-like domain-containing protein [Ganoderma leucocontextum]|nr:kinase-like domain-containing protein [Ganoderma leucocontextum]
MSTPTSMETPPDPSDQRPASRSEEVLASTTIPPEDRPTGHVTHPTPMPEGLTENRASPIPPGPSTPSVGEGLDVSDTILGRGSYGTVVFRGSFEGRVVAVKNTLLNFVTLFSREVNIVRASGSHPNVMQYYHHETDANFLYIAFELCPATLADVFESSVEFRAIRDALETKPALRQITAGLHHLHALNIIHRDVKPENILVSPTGENGGLRMLISDYGMCKKFEYNRKGYRQGGASMAVHTLGWRAPEVIRGDLKFDDANDESQSPTGSIGSSAGTPTGGHARLTKAVDIFPLGCLYYYVLTQGLHPLGRLFEREPNILNNVQKLQGLEQLGEEGEEGRALIKRMLRPKPDERPDTSICLMHPYFWDDGQWLAFLLNAWELLGPMHQDAVDPTLRALEQGGYEVLGSDRHSRLHELLIENLDELRKYDGKSVQLHALGMSNVTL